VLTYDNDAIIELCSKVDLLEYASQTYDFQRKGENYFTNCPKHTDLTPSLSITPNKNLFYCFSCGRSGNILNWLMEYENLKFKEALDKVVNLAGENVNKLKLKQPNAMSLYKKIKRITEIETNKTITRKILDESILNNYKTEYPQEWIEEGINPKIMAKYNVRIDDNANRIIYPVYDKDFNLIGIKGRTRYKDYKERNLMKYQNYYKIGTTDFFTGMKENLDIIKQKNEVIVFEGIKSGMKAEAWGYDNWVASETSHLNDEQIKILLDLKIKEVIIAYDNDVELQKIKDCTKMLRKFTNVFVIYDKKGLLGKKTDKLSPVDLGKDIWEILYKERMKI
jgi:DNA primase